jgi:ABC-type nitrate/sulfonate/bicarbonate transport system permease component
MITKPITTRDWRLKASFHSRGFLARFGPAALLGGIVLAVWQLYVSWAEIVPSVLPTPTRVAAALYQNAGLLWHHTLTTLLETGLGLILAVATALVLAVLIDSSETVRRAVYPWLIAFRTVPIIVLAPLMLIWFGFGLLPKVLLVGFFCFFPIVVATTDGLARADPELLKLMRAMKATHLQTLRLVRWPTALPSFFSGLRIAAAYSVTAAIFAEYVGGYSGLGILMQTATNARATPLVFAAIVITALASFAIFALVSLLEHLVLPRRLRH